MQTLFSVMKFSLVEAPALAEMETAGGMASGTGSAGPGNLEADGPGRGLGAEEQSAGGSSEGGSEGAALSVGTRVRLPEGLGPCSSGAAASDASEGGAAAFAKEAEAGTPEARSGTSSPGNQAGIGVRTDAGVWTEAGVRTGVRILARLTARTRVGDRAGVMFWTGVEAWAGVRVRTGVKAWTGVRV